VPVQLCWPCRAVSCHKSWARMIQLLYLETQPRSGGIFLWALRPMICSRHFSEVKIRASWQMWPGGPAAGPGN
jgi:hypothetical protein